MANNNEDAKNFFSKEERVAQVVVAKKRQRLWGWEMTEKSEEDAGHLTSDSPSHFFAILERKKRMGVFTIPISPDEFRAQCGSFLEASQKAFHTKELKLTMRRNWYVPEDEGGMHGFRMDQGLFTEGLLNPGMDVPFNSSHADFRELFEASTSMSFEVRPEQERPDLKDSYGIVHWTRKMPNRIFFFAQQAGERDPECWRPYYRPVMGVMYGEPYLNDEGLFYGPREPDKKKYRVYLGLGKFFDTLSGTKS